VEEDVDGDGILLENDPVDDDITISIASDYDRPFSHTSSLEQQRAHIASSDGTPPPVDSVGVPGSFFVSVLSYFYLPGAENKPSGSGH